MLDEKHPHLIRYRSSGPVLTPELLKEREGIVPNVVFPTAIDRRDDLGLPGRFDVYYGMADNRIGVARLDLPEHLPTEAMSQMPSSGAEPLQDAPQNDFPAQIAVKPISPTRCLPDANSEQKRKQIESNKT